MIQTMEPWHLLSVVMKSDYPDLGGDLERQRWACRRALDPGVGFAVLDTHGVPVACFGFVEEPGVCSAWMISTPGWRCYVKSVAKVFKLVAKEGGYRRIQAYIEPERAGAARFLEWLGFRLDGSLPNMRTGGRSMDLYSYT